MSTIDGSATLKHQFELLQQQQQQKLARRKQKKEEREKTQVLKSGKNTGTPNTNASVAFGIDDDLDLKLAEPPDKQNGIFSEELVDHLNEQIRELKDETGRLYKLLSERDLEIRQLRKKQDQAKAAQASSGAVASETAATKIVELSKKIRELTAELESEKSKAKQWAKKCFDMENELKKTMNGNNPTSARSAASRFLDSNEDKSQETEIKTLQEKLRQSENKVTEFRNSNSQLKQELKVAHKVLSSEVGEGLNIQSLLNAPSGYRGRAQQIIALQKKVQELKSQLETSQMGSRAGDLDLEEDYMGTSMMGSSTYRKSAIADGRQREQLRKIEKERKESQERMVREFKALEKDYESLKQKLEASKARNKVITTEMKATKQQLATLLEKGKHDDELIEALMKQLSQLKVMMESNNQQQKVVEGEKESQLQQMAQRQQQENNIVMQLKSIVAEKEAKVKALEEEVNNMKAMSLQKAQMNGISTMFERASSRAESVTPVGNTVDDGTRLTSASSGPPGSARLSERSISRQSTLDGGDQLTDRPASRKHSARTATPGLDKAALDELQAQCQEFRSLYQATEVERDRLAQFVQVLEKRVAESTTQCVDANNELQNQKRRNVQLEKQLGKVKIEIGRAGPSATKRSGLNSSRVRASATSLQTDALEEDLAGTLEETQTRLEIQKDENEALKAALQSTLKAKEEDLKLYADIMEETKRVFLQGLRQYRQGQT